MHGIDLLAFQKLVIEVLERQQKVLKTLASAGETLELEAISRSLSALKDVHRAMVDPEQVHSVSEQVHNAIEAHLSHQQVV